MEYATKNNWEVQTQKDNKKAHHPPQYHQTESQNFHTKNTPQPFGYLGCRLTIAAAYTIHS